MDIRVQDLFLYPVKSCGGIAVPTLEFGPAGPRYDREWAIVEGGTVLSQKKNPMLCRIRSAMTADELILRAGDREPVRVPLDHDGGKSRRVRLFLDHAGAADQGDEAAAWLSDVVGRRVRLMRFDPVIGRTARLDKSPKAFADMASVLLIAQASLDYLNSHLETPLPINRFRPNIVVNGCGPFAEDLWAQARMGEVVLRGGMRCMLCAVPTTDQETGERSKEPLRTLAKIRKNPTPIGVVFGRYFQYLSGARVSVGDVVATET